MRGYKHKERLICEVLLPLIAKEVKLKKMHPMNRYILHYLRW